MAGVAAFDLDGTLVDTAADICLHVNGALSDAGRAPLPEETIRPFIGRGAANLVQRVTQGAGDDVAAQVLAGFRRRYLERPVVSSSVYPGAADALRRLGERGVRRVVVTNKPHEVSVRVLELLGLAPLLERIRGATEGVPHKPAPQMLAAAVAPAGPSSTVMVGDSVVDLETALAFGARFVGVAHGMDRGAGLAGRGIALEQTLSGVAERVLGLLGAA
ncbi:MAG: HAD family hydrolase [Deltaproteobacteria bacterium]|nr:HAD family hydrolase [Deltaproteobacteria bacterium]